MKQDNAVCSTEEDSLCFRVAVSHSLLRLTGMYVEYFINKLTASMIHPAPLGPHFLTYEQI
jgi:hypothetical protein